MKTTLKMNAKCTNYKTVLNCFIVYCRFLSILAGKYTDLFYFFYKAPLSSHVDFHVTNEKQMILSEIFW